MFPFRSRCSTSRARVYTPFRALYMRFLFSLLLYIWVEHMEHMELNSKRAPPHLNSSSGAVFLSENSFAKNLWSSLEHWSKDLKRFFAKPMERSGALEQRLKPFLSNPPGAVWSTGARSFAPGEHHGALETIFRIIFFIQSSSISIAVLSFSMLMTRTGPSAFQFQSIPERRFSFFSS